MNLPHGIAIVAFAVAMLLPDGALAAQDPLALATGKACMGCHKVDAKLVGPAFKDVAAKHGDTKAGREVIAKSILEGSQGKWGVIPMPANAAVGADDAGALAAWIAATK